MLNVSEGPSESATEQVETVEEVAAPDVEGFAQALQGFGPPGGEPGQPEQPEAVDGSEAPEPPSEPEKAPDESKEESDKPEETKDTQEPEQTINFDGFSDEQKTTFEELLKAGHVTPEFVEALRLGTMFQRTFTKKTTDLSRARKAWEEEVKERREDLSLLDELRKDDDLYAKWVRFSKGETSVEDAADDDLVDRKTAAKIAEERYEARKAADEARTKAEQRQYEEKVLELQGVLKEATETLGATPQQLEAYLKAEEALLPSDVDPILHFGADDLRYRLAMRHEAALARAEAEKWRKQVEKKTSDDARTAKQSLTPPARVASDGALTPKQRLDKALQLEPDWSNVTGFGNPS